MLDWLSHPLGNLDDPERTVLDQLSGSASRYLVMKEAREFAKDWFLDRPQRQLQEENQRLDIALKKRALSMPLNDDEYEYLVNEPDSSRTKKTMAMLGAHTLGRMPEPESAIKYRETLARFNTRPPTNMIPSFMHLEDLPKKPGGIARGLSNVARKLGTAGKLFF